MSSNHNQSHNNSNSENDPLSQLNQLHQSTQPNQLNNQQTNPKVNQQSDQSDLSKQQSEPQNAMKKTAGQFAIWWDAFKKSGIAAKLQAHRQIVLIVGGAALAIFAVLYIVLTVTNSSEKLVADFEEAMIEEDKDTLKDLLVSDQSSLEINDTFLTKLIQQGKEDDDYLSETVSLMKAQKNIYNEKQVEANTYLDKHDLTRQEILNTGNLYVKKNDSLFGGDYVIGVRPAYIKISASIAPTELKIDGKKVKLKKGATEQIHGPILPGKYKVEAIKKYQFSVVTDDEEVNLFEQEERTANVFFELAGKMVSFKSEIENTKLFINNQSTKQQVGSNSVEFGPVSTNGKLQAHGQLELPWGLLKSNPVPIKEVYGSIDVTPNPLSDVKVKKDIIQVINNYAQEYVTAQVKQDANLFTSLDEEQKKEWANDFADNKEYQSNYYYKGKALKTLISVKKSTLSQGDSADVYKVKVPVQFHRNQREYGRFDSGDEPLKEVTKDTYVWLIYNNQTKKWEITGINSMFFSNDTFKDSSVVTTSF